MDFITTLEAENWLWNPQRQSEVWSDGVRENSRWFCQVYRWSSSTIWDIRIQHHVRLDDPRFFENAYWQMELCWKLWSERYRRDIQPKTWRWATMFWYNVRHWLQDRFTFDGTLVQQQHLTVKQSIPTTINTYLSARKAQDKSDESWKQAVEDKRIAEEKWKLCKETGDCVE